MKKILIFAVLLPAILLCFTSCEWMFIPPDDDTTGGQHTTTGEGAGTEDDTTSATSETVYSLLTSLSAQSYREVALQITTQTGDVTLQARYLLTPSLVTYEVEHLNLLPPDGDLTGVSPDYKTTLSGSATIENGKVTKPVEQITVADNFFALLKKVVAVADDLDFMPGISTSIGAPSVYIENISVAGK